MSVSIWWIRRDLRLHDNLAMQAALSEGSLLPVFILDPVLLSKEAAPRQGFLFAGLCQLDQDLRARGSRLLIRRGDPLEELARLKDESGVASIHAAEDYTPYARRRDELVARALPLRLHAGLTVHHPLVLRKPDGRPYTVFTPFSRTWKALPFCGSSPSTPASLPPVPDLPGEILPDLPAPSIFPAGEAEALRRLEAFLAGPGAAYADGRNRLDLEGSSALSPYLRFGMLSPRLAAGRAIEFAHSSHDPQASRGYETWLNELIWREFYQMILYEFPTVLRTAFNPALRRIPWREAPEDLLAWREGRTGFPVVDAGMRQLAAAGWMHNRARMITASFLTKDLLIDWRLGEAWFMRCLVDGDPASNNGGWQWSAGTGTDAAPYFRIFNPVLQGQKFDPRGDYVRRWVPELASVPDVYIHAPWQMPEELQRSLGVWVGQDYPAPMVDRAAARERALAAYRASSQR